MQKIIRKLSFEEGEDESLAYWADLPVAERFRQAFEWNNKVWCFLKKGLEGMDKTVGAKRSKTDTDEDDF